MTNPAVPSEHCAVSHTRFNKASEIQPRGDPARLPLIVDDPTVGEPSHKFGHIFRRPRGMYLSLNHKGA